jgi:hypothetical protein
LFKVVLTSRLLEMMLRVEKLTTMPG